MSIQVMSMVWDWVAQTPAQKLIFLALADNANNQGECWPSIKHIARKCGVCKQTALTHIEELTQLGLVVVQKAHGKVNHYRIRVEELVQNLDRSKNWTGLAARPLPVQNLDHHRSKNWTTPVQNLDPNHQEPPIEPSLEPPREEKGESAPLPGEADRWNNLRGMLPEIVSWNSVRTKALTARRKEKFWVENFDAAVDRMAKSDFFNGKNERQWKGSIDWLLRPGSMSKVMEGNYENVENKQQDSFWKLKAELEMVDSELKKIRARASEAAGGSFTVRDADKARWDRLRDRRSKLKEQLGLL